MSRIGQPFSCEEHKHDLGSPLPGACDSCGCVCVCGRRGVCVWNVTVITIYRLHCEW